MNCAGWGITCALKFLTLWILGCHRLAVACSFFAIWMVSHLEFAQEPEAESQPRLPFSFMRNGHLNRFDDQDGRLRH